MLEILMLHFRHKIVKTANRLIVTTAPFGLHICFIAEEFKDY